MSARSTKKLGKSSKRSEIRIKPLAKGFNKRPESRYQSQRPPLPMTAPQSYQSRLERRPVTTRRAPAGFNFNFRIVFKQMFCQQNLCACSCVPASFLAHTDFFFLPACLLWSCSDHRDGRGVGRLCSPQGQPASNFQQTVTVMA